MEKVIFQTATLLDIKAITTFGINAKPNSISPIGFFGTGLKYAIAVLCRENCKVTIHIGTSTYEFNKNTQNFRDKSFDFIEMVKGTGEIIDLPFTTELGKNWELWQAFRELYSNTLDEDGSIFSREEPIQLENYTMIIVEGENFLAEYENKDTIFLREGNKDFTSVTVQMLECESKHLYYRSMRALDLARESLYTYNILTTLELTEDRTIKYVWMAERVIAHYIAVTCTDESVIEKVLSADENTFEGKLDFGDVYATSSGPFARVYHRLGKNIQNESVRRYFGSYGLDRVKPTDYRTWQEQFLSIIRSGSYSLMPDLIELYKDDVVYLLENSAAIDAKYKELHPLIEVNDNQLDLFAEADND